MVITGPWKQDEITNANELFLNYKMSIPDMARIINRSVDDIKTKFIELKLIEDNNPILTLIKPLRKEEVIPYLCQILSNLESRINILEKR